MKGFIQKKKKLIKDKTDPVISFPQRKVNTAVGEVVHPRCSFMAEWWLSVKLEGTSRSQGLFSLSRAQRALFPASASPSVLETRKKWRWRVCGWDGI